VAQLHDTAVELMRKIPTVFVRDPDNRKRVTSEVTPGCEWVLDGEGCPTRKYDGTCVAFDGVKWVFRREVKPGKPEPDEWVHVGTDENTGKRVGWEPATPAAGFIGPLREAIDAAFEFGSNIPVATYELCGPKINGNPEGFASHRLIQHDEAEVFVDAPRTFETLGPWLIAQTSEGIVWHHPDGRMAKLKRRDFS